jgi:hypothetical protein
LADPSRIFLLDYRPLADSWYLLNNSGREARTIAVGGKGVFRIIDSDTYSALTALYGGS